MNRGNNRARIFHKAGDYEAFLTVLTIALARFDVELLCWCIMPNHWHLVVRPRRPGVFPEFMRWLTTTHVRRYQEHYPEQSGHLYQGRYKAFPVQTDEHFLILCRYVEANALRAKLVERAENWQWSSLSQRKRRQSTPPVTAWPVDRSDAWLAIVNEPQPEAEQSNVRVSLERQRPFGQSTWATRIAKKLGLEKSLAPIGRQRKPDAELSPRQRRRRAAESMNAIN
jgi:putative transposase